MDTKLIEQQDKWRDSAEAFRRQVTQERTPVMQWTGQEFLTLVHDCRRAGLLYGNHNQSLCPDLKRVATVIEELSLIDASLGLLATSEYLCSRVMDHISDPQIRSRMKQHFFALEPALGMRWLSPAPGTDNQALTFAVGGSEPSFVGVGLLHPGKDRESILLITGSRMAPAQTTPFALTGLEVLQFQRIDLNVWFDTAAPESESSLMWSCSSEELHYIQNALQAERDILFSVVLSASARKAFQYAMEYSRERRAFGKPICQHQSVMLRLADMAMADESSQLMIAETISCHAEMRAVAAQRTWDYCREAGINTALQASQLLGGHGYLADHPVQKWVRDIQSLRIVHKMGWGTCLSSN